MSNTIKPADRLNGVGEYYLQRKMKEVAALNARGLDIISLGIGGPDMMPPAAAILLLHLLRLCPKLTRQLRSR